MKITPQKIAKVSYAIVAQTHYCELCMASQKPLDIHHIMGRQGALLYRLENLIRLCVDCHRIGVHSTDAKVQRDFRQRIFKLRSEEKLLEIKRIIKPSIFELEQTYQDYKLILSKCD